MSFRTFAFARLYGRSRMRLPSQLPQELIDRLLGLVDAEQQPIKRSSTDLPPLKITQAAHDAILQDLVQRPFRHEQGGILLGPEDTEELVTHYLRDDKGKATSSSFTIDHESLNQMIRDVRPARLACVGIIHSHPDSLARPSGGDVEFLLKLFSNPKNGKSSSFFHFPIVCNGKIHPFIVDTANVRNIFATDLVIV